MLSKHNRAWKWSELLSGHWPWEPPRFSNTALSRWAPALKFGGYLVAHFFPRRQQKALFGDLWQELVQRRPGIWEVGESLRWAQSSNLGLSSLAPPGLDQKSNQLLKYDLESANIGEYLMLSHAGVPISNTHIKKGDISPLPLPT